MAEGKNLKVALLLDLYGEMLTEKQREVIDLPLPIRCFSQTVSERK